VNVFPILLEHSRVAEPGGPRGAAAKLGLKRTTLLARMKRLGISRISQEGTDVFGLAQDAQI